MSQPSERRLVTEAALAAALEKGAGGGGGVQLVSGTVTLDATGAPIREFYTTGASVFRANGVDTPLGAYTAVVWRRTAQGSWGYQVVQDGWTTPTPTPDTTAPVAGTLTVTVTDVKADLTVSGASDDRGVVSYAFSKDNGTTWTAYQDAASYTFTGLTASTSYQFRHRVKDAAGNTVTGTAVTRTTASAPPFDPSDLYPDADVIDTFTGAPDGTVLAGSNGATWSRRTVEKGGLQWGAWAMPLMPAPNVENTGYPATTAAKITGGKVVGSALHSSTAMLTLPQTSARIEVDYDVTATSSRVSLALAGSATQGITARVFQAEGLKVFRDGVTQLGSTIPLATFGGPTGRLGLTYDAATGKVTVTRDGVEKFSATTTTGLTGTYAAVDAQGLGTFDNVTVTYL